MGTYMHSFLRTFPLPALVRTAPLVFREQSRAAREQGGKSDVVCVRAWRNEYLMTGRDEAKYLHR